MNFRWTFAEPRNFTELQSAWNSEGPLVLFPPLSGAERDRYRVLVSDAPPPGARVAVFTSGSTGEPKLVVHTEENLRVSARQVAAKLEGASSVATTLAPWGMAGLLLGCVLPWAESGLRSGGVAVAEAANLDVDILFTNPWHLDLVFHGGHPRTRRIVSLTGSLPPVWRERGVEEIFGATEAAGPVLWNGKSLGARCELGGEGELLLSGAQLSPFLPQPFPTGDLFEREGDGLRWLARKRQMINVAGRKIPPRLVEEIALALPGVKACVALPVSDPLYGERVGLVIEGEEPKEWSSILRERFSRDFLPSRWVWVAQMPRLASGKPDLAASRLLLR